MSQPAANGDLPALIAAPEHRKRKVKVKSPNARSLEELRKRGYRFVDIVEQRIPHCMITRDLWGCIDILALHEEHGVLAVQATSGSNVAARIDKITESGVLPLMLKWGFKVVVHGWRKNSEGRWVLREVEM